LKTVSSRFICTLLEGPCERRLDRNVSLTTLRRRPWIQRERLAFLRPYGRIPPSDVTTSKNGGRRGGQRARGWASRSAFAFFSNSRALGNSIRSRVSSYVPQTS